MYTLRIGRKKYTGYSSVFGGLSLKIQKKFKKMTLEQIAKELAGINGIKQGKVCLHSIEFNYEKGEV